MAQRMDILVVVYLRATDRGEQGIHEQAQRQGYGGTRPKSSHESWGPKAVNL